MIILGSKIVVLSISILVHHLYKRWHALCSNRFSIIATTANVPKYRKQITKASKYFGIRWIYFQTNYEKVPSIMS